MPFKHDGCKDGVAIKRNRLIGEIRYADTGMGYEISNVFNRMKLKNCQEHRKRGNKALERVWN